MTNDMPPNDDGQIGPISSGLIIDKPWIGFLLDGTKKWEMRSTITNKRGWIGLIPKGSGEVAGIARIVDVGRACPSSGHLAQIAA